MNKAQLIEELRGFDHDCKLESKGFCKHCDSLLGLTIKQLKAKYGKFQEIKQNNNVKNLGGKNGVTIL